MEHNIIAQREGVLQSVAADGPALGNGGLHRQHGVELHEAVVELAAGPDDGLVAGKGGVEGGDAGTLVVAEDHLVVVAMGRTGGKQQQEGVTAYRDPFHIVVISKAFS